MRQHDEPAHAGANDIPVTYGSVSLTVDRGDTIWFLIVTDRPGADGGTERVAERWVCLPRAGCMTSLLSAARQLLPGFHDTAVTEEAQIVH